MSLDWNDMRIGTVVRLAVGSSGIEGWCLMTALEGGRWIAAQADRGPTVEGLDLRARDLDGDELVLRETHTATIRAEDVWYTLPWLGEVSGRMIDELLRRLDEGPRSDEGEPPMQADIELREEWAADVLAENAREVEAWGRRSVRTRHLTGDTEPGADRARPTMDGFAARATRQLAAAFMVDGDALGKVDASERERREVRFEDEELVVHLDRDAALISTTSAAEAQPSVWALAADGVREALDFDADGRCARPQLLKDGRLRLAVERSGAFSELVVER